METRPIWKNEAPTIPGEYWYSPSNPAVHGGMAVTVSVFVGVQVESCGLKAWCRDMSELSPVLFAHHRAIPASEKRLCVKLPTEDAKPLDEEFYSFMWFAGPLPEAAMADEASKPAGLLKTLGNHLCDLLEPGETVTFAVDFDAVSGFSAIVRDDEGGQSTMGIGGEARVRRTDCDPAADMVRKLLREVREVGGLDAIREPGPKA